MEERLIHLEGVGKVRLIKSERARNITISLRPVEGIRVTLPYAREYSDAERFVKQKAAWIKQQQLKIQSRVKAPTIFNELSKFRTRHHQLLIRKHEKATLKISVTGGFIRIWYPVYTDAAHEKVQKAIMKGIEEAWRLEAKYMLPLKVEQLARKFGFSYHSVTIKNARTRWGSCSHDNRINLSLHLMMLPDHLIDYIILHELCHTTHKNHGKGFYAQLNKLTGGIRSLENELGKYKIGIL
jgi:predicted metal-dependent hydrolase